MGRTKSDEKEYGRSVQDESKTLRMGIDGFINRNREIRTAGSERMRHMEFKVIGEY